MMNTRFVDAEIDNLKKDFASDEMNAFGNREMQQEFLSSFKRIANLEAEVFYKSCSILKSHKTGDASTKGMMASPKDRQTAGGSLGDSLKSLETSTLFGANDTVAGNVNNASLNATLKGGGRFAGGRYSQPASEAPDVSDREDDGGEPPEPDTAFSNIAKHFHALEDEFISVGKSLHEISREVIRMDVMGEKLNNTYMEDTFDKKE